MFGLFFPNYRLFLMAVGAVVIAAVGWSCSAPGSARWCVPPPSTATWPASLGVPVAAWSTPAPFAFGVALAGLSGVLARADLPGVPDHGARLRADRLQRGDHRRHGPRSRARWIAGLLLTQVQSISSPVISPVERSAVVRDHGAGADVAPARSVRGGSAMAEATTIRRAPPEPPACSAARCAG